MADIVGDSYRPEDLLVIASTRLEVNKNSKSEFYCFDAGADRIWLMKRKIEELALWERVDMRKD